MASSQCTPDTGVKRPQHALSPASPTELTPPSSRLRLDISDGIIEAMKSPSLQNIFKAMFQDILEKEMATQREQFTSLLNQKDQTIKLLEQSVATLQEKVAKLESGHDGLEQYGRRYSLRVKGIPETEQENTDTLILDLAKKMDVPLELQDISRSHRLGKPSQTPRPIICRFTTYRARANLYKARRSSPKGVFLNEDLTKNRQHLLYLCRQSKRDGNIIHCWSSDGQILVRKEERGTIVAVNSASDLEQLSK